MVAKLIYSGKKYTYEARLVNSTVKDSVWVEKSKEVVIGRERLVKRL